MNHYLPALHDFFRRQFEGHFSEVPLAGTAVATDNTSFFYNTDPKHKAYFIQRIEAAAGWTLRYRSVRGEETIAGSGTESFLPQLPALAILEVTGISRITGFAIDG